MAKVNFEGLSSVAKEWELMERNKEDVQEEDEDDVEEEKEDDGDKVEEEQEEENDDDDDDEEEGYAQDPEDESCKFSEYDDLEELTDDGFPDDISDEFREYCKQAARTGGFNVPRPPKGTIGGINPLIPGRSSYWTLAEEAAEIAVEHYNEKRAAPDGKLQVVGLETVNGSVVAGMVFYITVEAVNVSSGEKKMYQTKVYWRFNGNWKVLLFRKKKHAV